MFTIIYVVQNFSMAAFFKEKSSDCRRVYLSWCPCVVEVLLLLTLLDLGGGGAKKAKSPIELAAQF